MFIFTIIILVVTRDIITQGAATLLPIRSSFTNEQNNLLTKKIQRHFPTHCTLCIRVTKYLTYYEITLIDTY